MSESEFHTTSLDELVVEEESERIAKELSDKRKEEMGGRLAVEVELRLDKGK